jgi:hypothetical protein
MKAFRALLGASLLAGCSGPAPQSTTYGTDDFRGSWALIAQGKDGDRVYMDTMGPLPAGTHKVADLGIVSSAGRKVERINVDCARRSVVNVSSFGDDAETTVDLAGDASAPGGPPSVLDFVCGRAKLPTRTINALPERI